ncbi:MULTISPECIES: circularly permuted type 2 ATP-grasp protein [unclassified Cellulophaga]|uniref:circularly permuted type 2 ATP-grasp protein n=1 Tax=unclassified Cellulophaga TaxID=2634405 RepID=UPI001C4E4E3A|nr:circularly permuted type 2 ATP-grasp protein [Cellulophaga sp. HaHa_2_1]QXP53128.1 circularly permuted type 2 ATP-grasp protein [Cellulophaga sp. HaHa_2_1]
MPKLDFSAYETKGFYDEMFDENKNVRPNYKLFLERLQKMSPKKLSTLQHATDRAQLSLGMTFNVYNDDQGVERILHLDIIPRIIDNKEWTHLERGLQQRIKALNLFIQDIYNDQKVLKDKIIPKEMIFSSISYLKELEGFKPPRDIWCHITGSDLIKGGDGQYYVLEDNLRCPSGVSYMLENREILKRTFPELFEKLGVKPVYDYTHILRDSLESLTDAENPTVVVLTPGIYNSAYFEHSYLAQQMGAELVEGKDLIVQNEIVYIITTNGLKRVDVIYRRVDDEFIDPLAFNKNSVLGTPGLFNAYLKGNVALVNAPGTGVVDDKAVYAYIPRIIKYYLGEDMILPNVKTYICDEEQDRKYVLENIHNLVVKQTDASGGYGMLVGPKSTKKEQQEFIAKIKHNPRNYIAQPMINLSRVPTITDENTIEGRHVDLRPYALYGDDIKIIPGALTRVALKKGSIVVNSSQGGGSKDTWVLNH